MSVPTPTTSTPSSSPDLLALVNYLTTTGNGFSTFAKLTRENYYQWQQNMTTLLHGLNQYEMVDGTLTAPTEPSLLAAYRLRAARAYMEIALRIEPEWKQPINGIQDPKQAWDKLNKTYGTALDGVCDILLAQLIGLRWDATTPIQVHQMRMEELRTKLRAAGQELDEATFLSHFLNSLPAEYEVFGSTVSSSDTVAMVANRLRKIELRRELRGDSGGALALVAGGKPRGAPGSGSVRGSPQRKGSCYSCGEEGHYAFDPVCPNFGKKGKGSGPPMQPAGQMFAAVEEERVDDSTAHTVDYYIDSGASSHFVPD